MVEKKQSNDNLEIKIKVIGLNFFYGNVQALFNINMDIYARGVTAFIGPSGCGKSTLLRVLDRMNDIIDGTRVEGKVLVDGEDIYQEKTNVIKLRKKVGMVFQKSNPFPKSVFENVAYGPRIHGIKSLKELEKIVESSLIRSGLWEEVKDRLKDNAMELSGGQQFSQIHL